MYKSFALGSLLFVGASCQVSWVAIRISTLSSSTQGDCLSSFTTTITPPLSYQTLTTTIIEPITTTETESNVEVTTESETGTVRATTSETEFATVPSITATTEVDTATITQTTTETITSTLTNTISTTITVDSQQRVANDDDALVRYPKSLAASASATQPSSLKVRQNSVSLCAGVRPMTVTVSGPVSTITVTRTRQETETTDVSVTSAMTTTATQIETETTTKIVTLTITDQLTSTIDETTTATSLETSTTVTTETTSTISTTTVPFPTQGVLQARGGPFNGQYAVIANGGGGGNDRVFTFVASLLSATTVLRTTPGGRLRPLGEAYFANSDTATNPFLVYFNTAADIATGNYIYIESTVNVADGRLSFSRAGVPALAQICPNLSFAGDGVVLGTGLRDGCTFFDFVFIGL
ncbi:hypothetical protein Micbo1qcDRAFT_209439 [Microdochium bolleyi]|uniref:Uncharacterized protein n=1 Tax=Microdochium bolleyi TaxID=196109 RepID=A0A136IMJ9_9PEZI|nr:hypothetical protein Micbo1qcDRAFT_209439 [Microdochium bolleyi]